MSGRPCPDRDHGYATVWSVGGVAVLVLIFAAMLAIGSAVATRHRVASAADLAALAAAESVPDGERAACDRARWVADQMRVHVDRCWLAGWDALVEVSAPLPEPLGRFGSATAHARAGPAEDATEPVLGSARQWTVHQRRSAVRRSDHRLFGCSADVAERRRTDPSQRRMSRWLHSPCDDDRPPTTGLPGRARCR
ncbi:MAG TPA: Rv3654c family TadE-like protein [Pseudonocardiaceae bacterium]